MHEDEFAHEPDDLIAAEPDSDNAAEDHDVNVDAAASRPRPAAAKNGKLVLCILVASLCDGLWTGIKLLLSLIVFGSMLVIASLAFL